MKNGSSLVKVNDSFHTSSIAGQIENENNIQTYYESKTQQISNTYSIDKRKLSQQQVPQKYNNMLPGKKLKAIRINSEKVSLDGIIHDWRQYQNRSQQSTIKQQNTYALQPSNYDISSLSQAIQNSPTSQNKQQETFKFTTNNFKKRKQNIQNDHSLDKIILHLNDETAIGKMNTLNQKQSDLNQQIQQSPNDQSICQTQREGYERDFQKFGESQKLHSIQTTDCLNTRTKSKIEDNSRQESPSQAALMKQNQIPQNQNMKNTYNLKQSGQSNYDQNRIRITNIINNNNNKNNGSQINGTVTFNPYDHPEQQILLNNEMNQKLIKQSQNQQYSSQKNSHSYQQVQQKLDQNHISNKQICQNNDTLYESIYQKQQQQFRKLSSKNTESDFTENDYIDNVITFETVNFDKNNNENSQEISSNVISKKRSISLQRNSHNNDKYQTNYQYQNLIQIQNNNQNSISKLIGMTYDSQKNTINQSKLNSQKKIQGPDIVQNYGDNSSRQSVNKRKSIVEDFKKTIDNNKIDINISTTDKKQLRQTIISSNNKINGQNSIDIRDKQKNEKDIGYNIIDQGFNDINLQNNEMEQKINQKYQRNNDNSFKNNEKIQKNNENNQNPYQIDTQKKNIKVQLNPISRQERAKSAQDTQLKAFNEETYIVNFDEQKQQILHVRKIRRKPVAENVLLSNQINISQDYYNTPVLSIKKKNSICQSDNMDKNSLQSIIYSKPQKKFSYSQPQKQNVQSDQKNTVINDNNQNKQLDFTISSKSYRKQSTVNSEEKVNIEREEGQRFKQVESGEKYIDSQQSTASASRPMRKDKNGSIKLIKLQQYYDLKYESKYGQFWDDNKRRASKQYDSIKFKYLNNRLNMSLNDPNFVNQTLQQSNQQPQLNAFNSISYTRAQSQNQIDDSKSVLKILYEKSKKDQDNQNLFNNPDPWEQDQQSDTSF